MNDADGFRLEAAEQFGFEDTSGAVDGYLCTEAQLIAFAKACERAGRAEASKLIQTTAHACREKPGCSAPLALDTVAGILERANDVTDMELAPLLEAERQRCLAEVAHFLPGKTYMTQGGQAMRIERWSGADGRYATEQSRRPVWYREDGKCDVREWSHYDLLPGAIDLEREPR